ncbi:hypothetical protein COOONC_08987 [Cooperia oncophora]
MLKALVTKLPQEISEEIDAEKRACSLVISGLPEAPADLRPSAKQGDLESKDEAGNQYVDDAAKAEALAQYFASVFIPDSSSLDEVSPLAHDLAYETPHEQVRGFKIVLISPDLV